MMLFDHRYAWFLLTPLLVVLISVCLWHVVRGKRKALRLPLRAGSLLLAVPSALLSLGQGCSAIFTVTTTHAPIYSPDGKHAIVVRDFDTGAVGNRTAVTLYSYHCLLEDHVAVGEWRFIDARNVHWASDSEVALGYAASLPQAPKCFSVESVRVSCVPQH